MLFDNIILEGLRSDQKIQIFGIENVLDTLLIESTPYSLSTNSSNTSKAIADELPISANNTRLRL